jgi:hypothetical protein
VLRSALHPLWATWLAILKAAHGRLLSEHERKLFAAVAGDRESPRRKVKELVAIASRRSGDADGCDCPGHIYLSVANCRGATTK